MTDKSHDEFVERWAKFVKNNPKNWQKTHSDFINAQFSLHKEFLKKLSKQKNGAQKIVQIYNIKNLNGYKKLLGIE